MAFRQFSCSSASADFCAGPEAGWSLGGGFDSSATDAAGNVTTEKQNAASWSAAATPAIRIIDAPRLVLVQRTISCRVSLGESTRCCVSDPGQVRW
jgi:hypothetical protein